MMRRRRRRRRRTEMKMTVAASNSALAEALAAGTAVAAAASNSGPAEATANGLRFPKYAGSARASKSPGDWRSRDSARVAWRLAGRVGHWTMAAAAPWANSAQTGERSRDPADSSWGDFGAAKNRCWRPAVGGDTMRVWSAARDDRHPRYANASSRAGASERCPNPQGASGAAGKWTGDCRRRSGRAACSAGSRSTASDAPRRSGSRPGGGGRSQGRAAGGARRQRSAGTGPGSKGRRDRSHSRPRHSNRRNRSRRRRHHTTGRRARERRVATVPRPTR